MTSLQSKLFNVRHPDGSDQEMVILTPISEILVLELFQMYQIIQLLNLHFTRYKKQADRVILKKT